MTQFENFIKKWPKNFSETIRIALNNFYQEKISRQQVIELINGDLEAALNTIELGIKQKVFSCSCEGSCPVCLIGEVSGHKCNSCNTEFCPSCHGIVNDIKSDNVCPCLCR